jgi:hypothetical protein
MQCNYPPFEAWSKIQCKKRYSGAICIWEYDVFKDTENIPKWYVFIMHMYLLFLFFYSFVFRCSVSYTHCCLCLWIINPWFPVQFFLTIILHRYIYLPYDVFKSIVWCPWIHIVTTSNLFDISESLKLWCINNVHTQWTDLDGAMYRVIDYLHCKKNII